MRDSICQVTSKETTQVSQKILKENCFNELTLIKLPVFSILHLVRTQEKNIYINVKLKVK